MIRKHARNINKWIRFENSLTLLQIVPGSFYTHFQYHPDRTKAKWVCTSLPRSPLWEQKICWVFRFQKDSETRYLDRSESFLGRGSHHKNIITYIIFIYHNTINDFFSVFVQNFGIFRRFSAFSCVFRSLGVFRSF